MLFSKLKKPTENLKTVLEVSLP